MTFIENFDDFESLHKQMRDAFLRFLFKVKPDKNVYGVAGAGKTTKMLSDFFNDDLTVEDKYVVVFNKKIREEIRERTKLPKKYIRTFDSLFYKVPLIENKDYFKVFKNSGINLSRDIFSGISPEYASYLSMVKGLDHTKVIEFKFVIEGFIMLYKRKNVLPFELQPYYLFYKGINVFDGKERIYIDEVQDISPLYYALLSDLVKYYFAGAGDQTLYFVFGARNDLYEKVFEQSKEKELLTKSHRVPKVISEEVKRRKLSMFDFETESKEQGFIRIISLDTAIELMRKYQESRYSIGILFRFREGMRKFMNELRWKGYYMFPDDVDFATMYHIVSTHGDGIKLTDFKKFFNYQEVKHRFEDVNGFLSFRTTLSSFIEDKKDDEFIRVLKESVFEEYEPLLKEAIEVYNEIKQRNLEVLLPKLFNTIHATKGAEADIVFLFYDNAKVRNMLNSGKIDEKEEKNVLYVAYTRAKKGLYLVR